MSKYDRHDYGRYSDRSRPEEPDQEAPYPRWVFRWAKNAWLICALGSGTGALLSLVLVLTAIWHPDTDTCNRLGASAGFVALFTAIFAAITGSFAGNCQSIRRKYLSWVKDTAKWEKYQEDERTREAEEFDARMHKQLEAEVSKPGIKKPGSEDAFDILTALAPKPKKNLNKY